MLRATSLQSTKTIVCEFDTSSPKAAFEISTGVSVAARNVFADAIAAMSGKVTVSGLHEAYRALVKTGLKKIQNVETSAGAVGAWTTPDVPDATLDLLAEVRLQNSGYDNLLNWLGAEIWKANNLSEEEKKVSA